MRKIIYGAAFAAGVLLVALLVVRHPDPVTASQFNASNITDVRAIEATIDMKALPRQGTLSEAEE